MPWPDLSHALLAGGVPNSTQVGRLEAIDCHRALGGYIAKAEIASESGSGMRGPGSGIRESGDLTAPDLTAGLLESRLLSPRAVGLTVT